MYNIVQNHNMFAGQEQLCKEYYGYCVSIILIFPTKATLPSRSHDRIFFEMELFDENRNLQVYLLTHI